jgi:hypothetical protein
VQSVLLSNGWEVRLSFSDVRIQQMQALIPPPRDRGIGPVAPALAGRNRQE